MSSADSRPVERWLQQLVDDRVPEDEHAEAVATIAADPDLARRLREYREINELLRTAYDPDLLEPVPDRLRRSAQLPRRRQSLVRAAGMAGLLVLGAGAGWTAREWLDPAPASPAAVAQNHLAAQAIDAHLVYEPEIRHPVEVTFAEREHLVTWLSKRVGSKLEAPDLGGVGFDLVGGRLLPADGVAAAQFMYQNDSGRRVTLYMRAALDGGGASALRFAERNHTNVVFWVDPPVAYALAGSVGRERLEQIARLVYSSLNP